MAASPVVKPGMAVEPDEVRKMIRDFKLLSEEVRKTGVVKQAIVTVSGAIEGLGVAVVGFLKNRRNVAEDWKIAENADFIEACDVLLQMMMEINKVLLSPVLSVSNLQYMKSELQKKHISISFYGDSNVGKSTILNSIMGDRYLPVSLKSETAVAVHVVFGLPTIEVPNSTDYNGDASEDELVEFSTHDVVATGVENIRKKLKEENETLRSHDLKGAMKEFTLRIKNPPPSFAATNFDLIDNPGCDEFSTGAIMERIKIAEDYSAAFVVVTSLDTHTNKSFSMFLKKIYSSNPAILKQNRLTVVINKMDEALKVKYRESSYTQDELITIIHKYLCEKVFECAQADFPKEFFVPICGIWAQDSRELEKHPDICDLQECIGLHTYGLRYLNGFKEKIKTTAYTELDSTGQAKLLEEYSNIMEVEKRIARMTESSNNIWRRKMESNVTTQIDILSEALKQQIPLCEGIIKDSSQRIKLLHNAISQCHSLYLKILLESKQCNKKGTLPTNLSTWKKFKSASETDMEHPENIQKEILGDVEQSLKMFKLLTSEKISNGNHQPKDLEEDLKKLLDGLSLKINNALSSRNSFIKLSEVYYLETTAVHSKTVRLKNKLLRILNREDSDEDCQIARLPYPKLSGPSLTIKLNIPTQLNFFQRFLNLLRAIVFRNSEEPLEQSYIFEASVIPEECLKNADQKNNSNDVCTNQSGYSEVTHHSPSDDTTVAAASMDSASTLPLHATPEQGNKEKSPRNGGQDNSNDECMDQPGSEITQHNSSDDTTASATMNSASTCSSTSLPLKSNEAGEDTNCSTLPLKDSATPEQDVKEKSPKNGDQDNSNNECTNQPGCSEIIQHNSSDDAAESATVDSTSSSTILTPHATPEQDVKEKSPKNEGQNNSNDECTDQPGCSEITQHNSSDDTTASATMDSDSTCISTILPLQPNEVGIKEESPKNTDQDNSSDKCSNQPGSSEHNPGEDSEAKATRDSASTCSSTVVPNKLQSDESAEDTNYTTPPLKDRSTETEEDANCNKPSCTHSCSFSTNPETRERTYKKWNDKLDEVRDNIRNDVIKDITEFFDDFDRNVILKFCQQHYEVALNMLKEFDSTSSDELKVLQNELEMSIKRFEEDKHTLEMLRNYDKKLDDMKKSFKDICPKAI